MIVFCSLVAKIHFRAEKKLQHIYCDYYQFLKLRSMWPIYNRTINRNLNLVKESISLEFHIEFEFNNEKKKKKKVIIKCAIKTKEELFYSSHLKAMNIPCNHLNIC